MTPGTGTTLLCSDTLAMSDQTLPPLEINL